MRSRDGLQRALGNRAATRVLARRVKLNSSKRLEKHGRLDFEDQLKTAMPVNFGQHRAHVIAYATIVRGVMDPINLCLENHDPTWLNATYNMIPTIYPGGGASLRHPALSWLASLNYNRALNACKAIVGAINGVYGAPPLADAANELIGALNNSPDNLRPGAGGTNSSIQQGLDLEPLAPPNNVQMLPAGTSVVDQMSGTNFTMAKIHVPICVLRVKPLDEWMVWKLLTTTWSNRNEMHLYSSGVKLQSSNYAGMTSGSMGTQNPTHVAIEVTDNPGVFYLFTL